MMVPIVLFLIATVVESQCHNRCSGNGLCGRRGCECFEGYEGVDCSVRSCPKARAWSDASAHSLAPCSNRGYCFDGMCQCEHMFEGLACERLKCDCSGHGECISGDFGIEACVCDPGFVGFDCSRLACERGDDRRTLGGRDEAIELFCGCDNCTFTIAFEGEESRTMDSASSSRDLEDALKSMRSLSSTSIEVQEGDVCKGATTLITFTRDAGDLPSFEVLSDDDRVYFVTMQTLNCTAEGGWFSLELDGLLTSLIPHDATSSIVENALSKVVDANVTGSGSLCPHNEFTVRILNTKTIPAFVAWQSLLDQDKLPLQDGLKIVTRDGTKEREYCNNAGFCDETGERTALNGTCQCDAHLTFDADFGTCGRPVYNTSAWTGVQRCAGYVVKSLIIDPLNSLFLYLTDRSNETSTSQSNQSSAIAAGLYVDHLSPDLVSGEYPVENRFNATNLSGIALDLSYRHLYYVDNSIGGVRRISMRNQSEVSFFDISKTIEGIALNLMFGERTGYVTDPGILGVHDGAIYTFNLDDPTTVKRLEVEVSDPRGIALDLEHYTMYWCDSMNNTVYRANLDGTSPIAVLQRGLRHPIGLVLDLRNYTMIVADRGQLVKADMAFELRADDSNLPYYQNRTWYQVIATQHIDEFSQLHPMIQPHGIVIDTSRDYLYWTDVGGVYYSDTNGTFGNIYPTKFQPHSNPKGIAIDNGMGPPAQFDHECYGHGYCGGPELNFRCICDDGWFGNCNMSYCPSGPSWFLDNERNSRSREVVQCSNAGICDLATGLCKCRLGFEGAACERMECPSDCSGHGNCLTMRQASPDEEYSEWDADRIQHCVCHSEGYWNGTLQNLSDWTGYDCSKRTCPTGDVAEYPTTTNGTVKSFEVQRLTCSGRGNFSLTFRKATTKHMSHGDLADTLYQNLLTLDTVGSLRVSPLNSTLCNNASIDITFTSELGDLPLMTATTTHFQGTLSVDEVVKGTKQDEVCSLHGICDEAKGECVCFDNYLSSDGDGNFGLRNDCGHAGTPGLID